ncbi:hypothetical protein RN001_011765 [Aquatica leii]|uniref:Uncharacterized protein n=1 Tax=Aquatica leii TaxID=1421715 RepID=A0AAN7QE40_9COLE|nr:hypothetical protein RN001_011765 [Aquatica leii]
MNFTDEDDINDDDVDVPVVSDVAKQTEINLANNDVYDNDILLSVLARQEPSTLHQKELSGRRKEDVYVSKWFAFSSFAFMINKNQVRETINTKTVPTSDIDIDGVSDSESEVDVSSRTDSINREKADVKELTSDDNINKQTPPQKLFLSPKNRFAEDYPKVILNVRQELVLIRSSHFTQTIPKFKGSQSNKGDWSVENMKKACDAVISDKIDVRQAALASSVPKNLFFDRIKALRSGKEVLLNAKLERFNQTFNSEYENILVNYIKGLTSRLMPLSRN